MLGTSWPRSARSRTTTRPALPLPPVTAILVIAKLEQTRSASVGELGLGDNPGRPHSHIHLAGPDSEDRLRPSTLSPWERSSSVQRSAEKVDDSVVATKSSTTATKRSGSSS